MDEVTARAVASQLGNPTGEMGRKVADNMTSTNAFITARAHEVLAVCSGQTILEIGPGNGRLSLPLVRSLGDSGSYVGIERSEEMAALAENTLREASTGSVQMHACDCREAPIAAASLDGLVAVNVLYFVDDLSALCEQILGWLRPGGRVVFGVRSAEVMQAFPVAQYGFVVRTLDQTLRCLSRTGFVDLQASYFDEGRTKLGSIEIDADSVIVSGRRGA